MPSIASLTRALLLTVLCVLPSTTTATPADLPASRTPEALSQMHSALTTATNLGIDLLGPIPDDYTFHNTSTGQYHFLAGSKASIWARGQLALSSLPAEELDETLKPAAGTLEKRNSGVGLGMWEGSWCSGSGWYIPNVVYSTTYSSYSPFISVGIAGRSLGNWEQLDFSKATSCPTHGCAPIPCGLFVYKAGTYTPPGCWNGPQYSCAKLWLY